MRVIKWIAIAVAVGLALKIIGYVGARMVLG